MNKKCLLVLTDLNMGGITTAAVNFCNELHKHNVTVDVLVMDPIDGIQKNIFNPEVTFLKLTGFSQLWNLGVKTIKKEKSIFKKCIYSIVGIVKKLLNRKSLWTKCIFGKRVLFKGYDAVIAYRQCAPCYHLALNCIEAKKYIGFIHGELKFMGDISTWYKYLPQFDSVAYVSNGVKMGFIEAFPELEKNAITIHNVFNIDEIKRKSELSNDIVMEKEKVNIVTVSRIENGLKGTGRLVPICKKLKDLHEGEFHWYVVGDGPDLMNCKNDAEDLKVNDHITFLGRRNNPYNILAQADVSALPTYTEAYPMVVGESLILGIPVVTTRYPAAEEIITNGKTGIVTEQSEDDLCKNLSLLIGNSEILEDMKTNCSKFKYDNEKPYKEFERVAL